MSTARDKAVQPTTQITIGDRLLILAFDFEAIAEAEEASGRSLISGMTESDFRKPPIRLVQAMMFGCLRKYQPQIAYAESKSFVTARTMADIWIKVIEAWNAAMVEPDVEEPAAGEAPGQS